MPDPITIKNSGDRELRLADHAVLMAGVDASGAPQPFQLGSGGAVATQEGANTSTTGATGTQGSKAVAAAGTPVRLTPTSTLVESVEIFARKDLTTANTGNVYVGFSPTAGQNLRVLTPGTPFTLTAPAGKKIDLNTIFVDAATNGDAVVWTAVN